MLLFLWLFACDAALELDGSFDTATPSDVSFTDQLSKETPMRERPGPAEGGGEGDGDIVFARSRGSEPIEDTGALPAADPWATEHW